MGEQDFLISFGAWIKQRRKALDLTQEELAQRAGCTVFALRKIEAEERRPSKQLAGLLAEALEIPAEDTPDFIRVARGNLTFERLPAPRPGAMPAFSPSSSPAAHNLPPAPTPLLGREPELAAMAKLFADPQCRLLTLTGMGGIGKTRLAIEFGLRRQAMFPAGVRYIPLAGVQSAEMIIPAMAEAFGFVFSGPADPQEQLIRYLAGVTKQPALLILDNLEHLIANSSTAVFMVSKMLQRLPQLKILTTSRERLNLHDEWMYELHGLPVPPNEYAGELESYGAAGLFMQCARRNQIGYAMTGEEQPALVRICHLLEGIPLAIELAAAWIPLLSCAEIAREVEVNIDFLTTAVRDIPERHRSLRATFDHSWRLLAGAERDALCRLSVFRGGFDRAAAESIAGASLPLLAALASKSLVRRAENGRYDLHEVIRQYALLYLREDEAHCLEIRDRHCQHYLQFVAGHEKALKSAAQQDALHELTRETDNIRVAWLWGIEREKFALLGTAVRSLGWMFEVSSLLHEGIEQLKPLVQVLKEKVNDREWGWVLGRTLTQQGLLTFRSGFFAQAQMLLQESLAILRPVGEPALLTDSLIYLGIISYLNGDLDRAVSLLEEGLVCAQSANEEWFAAFATLALGQIAGLKGQDTAGLKQMRAGVAIWRRLGDPHAMALGLNYLCPTLVILGQFEEAEASLLESLELCRRTRNRWGLGTAYRYLGLVKTAQGDYAAAEAFLRQGLETFGDYIVGWDIACSYNYLGNVALLQGDIPAARKHYLKAFHLALEIKSVPLLLDALVGLAEIDQQTDRRGRALAMANFILLHPAATNNTKERVQRIIYEQRMTLS